MPFGSELASAAAFWNRVNSVLRGVCAPRGGISSVTHPNTRNCRPRGADAEQRRVLCVCQRP